jgi:hypothetical protein
VYFGNEELRISMLNNSSDAFPSEHDYFESFDEPAMRGLLTQTSAARKLARHSQEVKLLRQSAMQSASSVPTAVVDLMESYLTPLL